MFSVGLFARCKQDLGRSPGRDLENGSVRIRILVGGGLLLVFRSQHDGGDARCSRMEDFRGTFRILLLLFFVESIVYTGIYADNITLSVRKEEDWSIKMLITKLRISNSRALIIP